MGVPKGATPPYLLQPALGHQHPDFVASKSLTHVRAPLLVRQGTLDQAGPEGASLSRDLAVDITLDISHCDPIGTLSDCVFQRLDLPREIAHNGVAISPRKACTIRRLAVHSKLLGKVPTKALANREYVQR